MGWRPGFLCLGLNYTPEAEANPWRMRHPKSEAGIPFSFHRNFHILLLQPGELDQLLQRPEAVNPKYSKVGCP